MRSFGRTIRVTHCRSQDRDWMVHILSHIHDYDEDYTMDLAELLPENWIQRNL